MDISRVHKRRCAELTAATADHNALRECFLGRCIFLLSESFLLNDPNCCWRFSSHRLLTPFLRRERNVFVSLADFAFRCPPCCTVLTVANGFGFYAVEIVDVGNYSNAAENTRHYSADKNQSTNA